MNDLKISQMKIGKSFTDVSGSLTSKRSSWNVSVRLLNIFRQFAQVTQKHYEASLHTDTVITENQRSIVYMRINTLE